MFKYKHRKDKSHNLNLKNKSTLEHGSNLFIFPPLIIQIIKAHKTIIYISKQLHYLCFTAWSLNRFNLKKVYPESVFDSLISPTESSGTNTQTCPLTHQNNTGKLTLPLGNIVEMSSSVARRKDNMEEQFSQKKAPPHHPDTENWIYCYTNFFYKKWQNTQKLHLYVCFLIITIRIWNSEPDKDSKDKSLFTES